MWLGILIGIGITALVVFAVVTYFAWNFWSR